MQAETTNTNNKRPREEEENAPSDPQASQPQPVLLPPDAHTLTEAHGQPLPTTAAAGAMPAGPLPHTSQPIPLSGAAAHTTQPQPLPQPHTSQPIPLTTAHTTQPLPQQQPQQLLPPLQQQQQQQPQQQQQRLPPLQQPQQQQQQQPQSLQGGVMGHPDISSEGEEDEETVGKGSSKRRWRRPATIDQLQVAQSPFLIDETKLLPNGELQVTAHCPFGTFKGEVALGLSKFIQ